MTDIDFRNKQYTRYEMWKKWDRDPFGSFNRKEHFYFKKLLEMLDSSSSNLSILELGFGNGSFAGWLKANHPQIRWSGVEIQDSLVNKAKDSGFTAMLTIPEPARENKYDVILAFDVIEHLSDSEISDFFTRVANIVKKGGIVLARTPNAGGPFGLPNQTGDPTHVTPISLSRLSSYLTDWEIRATGDIQPVWEGKLLSAIRNLIRLCFKILVTGLVRFAFAPQPHTLLASNLHLTFKLKN
jgi:2-polyprenyl-3-methyl-5-hydroxy-6-metoxy-1,4-benzoquinol methylase